MKFKITTNQREFEIDINDMTQQSRGGTGRNILGYFNTKLKAKEEILGYEVIE